ncbi:hypothetical protein ACE6H2_011934 [Prunus campanulata]
MEETEAEAMLRGQADIWKYMFGFADSMALKCAVELRIADIIHSHAPTDHMITLSQIASHLVAPSPDITCLTRIMRLLVRRNIFAVHHPSEGGEPVYGLTCSSRWLLHDSEMSLAPMLVMENHPSLMAPWHYFSQSVKKGGPSAFKKAHGLEIWEFASENPGFNKLFNDGMACTSRIVMKAILTEYGHGFDGVGSLVDVGGGTGSAVAEIVQAYPNIRGFNFDLPHVVATAPAYHGVSHVGGDMFEDHIPNADAVFMKFIMHDWNDCDCIKILKNCRKAIPERGGKIMIVDIVLEPSGDGVLDDTRLVLDLVMIAHASGGKERTENEWEKILKEGGFPRYKIIKIPALVSIIEAYPV